MNMEDTLMDSIEYLECWGGDGSCPVPTEHRIRLSEWETGPDAGSDRMDYLHHVLHTRRAIRVTVDIPTFADALWRLTNVGRAAGRLRALTISDEQLLACALQLGASLCRKLHYISKEAVCHDVDF